ncbi:MAG: sodium:proton antiporter [Rhodospirillales bacterium 20-60-12]|nr:MAG: sodium:proton antiporter [Rhodospirillales bacterium 20-60-12]HQT68692.1 Mrp/NBP35 family ATP-binding protein [Acetobacteraceae bacterium]
MDSDESAIRATLATFKSPSGPSLAHFIDSIHLKDGLVQLALAVKREDAPRFEAMRRDIEAALMRLPGIRNVTVLFTAHKMAATTAPAAHSHAPAESGLKKDPSMLPEVKTVIAVASGKGGVGKSTIAVNLAIAFAQLGLRTGLLDADIYGPSMPRMLGITRKPDISADKQIVPLQAWGLKAMSIGFMVPEDTAMVWRGPMVMGALNQMLGQVAWGPLDIMIVDMPPGTGDAQLTMAQKINLAGAIIVSTPQDIALIDARRGVKMFDQVQVKTLGIIENMSYFTCPHCSARSEIFGHGGARAEAAKIGAPFLGEIPLQLAIRETGDAGTPITAADPDSEAGRLFIAIASQLKTTLGLG